MGWKGAGHGLGKHQQGITKPIEVDQIRERSGIGCHPNYDEYFDELNKMDTTEPIESIQTPHAKSVGSRGKANNPVPLNRPAYKRFRQDFRTNIQNLLKNFIASVTEEDLVFDKGLTNEERAMVHKEAGRYGLKTRSQGTGENRFLVAQKRRTAGELMENIKKNGGQFSKYELVTKGKMQ